MSQDKPPSYVLGGTFMEEGRRIEGTIDLTERVQEYGLAGVDEYIRAELETNPPPENECWIFAKFETGRMHVLQEYRRDATTKEN